MKTPNVENTRPQTINPKTVTVATYLQSLAIAILMTGILAAVGSYFFTINLHSSARAAVVEDMSVVKK